MQATISQFNVKFQKPSLPSKLSLAKLEAGFDWHYPNLPLVDPSQKSPIKMMEDDHLGEGEREEDVLLADPELKKPSMYAVVMYNDNYTPMEFVVMVLQEHFKHNLDSAVAIMLNIHQQGKGIAGIYPKDIAETKAQTVNREAQIAGFPLLTQIEPQPGE